MVELDHAVGNNEGVVVGQRDDAGAEAYVAGAFGSSGDERRGAADVLVAAGMVFADPGLVVVQLVEVDEQIHVALEGERRVFVVRMKWREKNPGAHVAVRHNS